ncbi:MAG: hypothetical protein H8Z69_01490 [Nanohaloarchaea archaeon]|nr:hypothetical protein [Candidatus Nanohaloarchaea archaeon]
MRIGVDFDRVLFDTDAFKEELESRFSRFSETYSKARNHEGYDFREHADILGVKPETLLSELENADNFLFSDVKQLDKLDHEKVIVTRGDPKFQRKKLENSGALKYFSDFFIVQDRSKEIHDIDVLVDDTQEELDRVDVSGILFKRSEMGMKDLVDKIEKNKETYAKKHL